MLYNYQSSQDCPECCFTVCPGQAVLSEFAQNRAADCRQTSRGKMHARQFGVSRGVTFRAGVGGGRVIRVCGGYCNACKGFAADDLEHALAAPHASLHIQILPS